MILLTREEELYLYHGKIDLSNSSLLFDHYWKSKQIPEFRITIIKEINKYRETGLSPLPYLHSLIGKYPNAPDILWYLYMELDREGESIEAFKHICKLHKLYPQVNLFKETYEETLITVGMDIDENNDAEQNILKRIEDYINKKSSGK